MTTRTERRRNHKQAAPGHSWIWLVMAVIVLSAITSSFG